MKTPKTIAEMKAHPLVTDFSDERGSGDGIWCYLVAGWAVSQNHMVHEDTVAQVKAQWKFITKCECDECKDIIAKKGSDTLPMAEKAARKAAIVASYDHPYENDRKGYGLCERCGSDHTRMQGSTTPLK